MSRNEDKWQIFAQGNSKLPRALGIRVKDEEYIEADGTRFFESEDGTWLIQRHTDDSCMIFVDRDTQNEKEYEERMIRAKEEKRTNGLGV